MRKLRAYGFPMFLLMLLEIISVKLFPPIWQIFIESCQWVRIFFHQEYQDLFSFPITFTVVLLRGGKHSQSTYSSRLTAISSHLREIKWSLINLFLILVIHVLRVKLASSVGWYLCGSLETLISKDPSHPTIGDPLVTPYFIQTAKRAVSTIWIPKHFPL